MNEYHFKIAEENNGGYNFYKFTIKADSLKEATTLAKKKLKENAVITSIKEILGENDKTN